MLELWEKPWTTMGTQGKGINCSPLMGKNPHSIVISSTNNKAIDNIGKELLREVSFFSEFADTAAADVIRRLRELLGDQLKYLPPSHVKLLLVDDKYLFIGSLNWLYNSGKTTQKEISCLLSDPDTIQYVKERFVND